jgi:hypothetical protein
MEKKVISIEQTSEDLCKIFGITEDNIEKLTDYFKDKVIDKGACTVDNITFLYTKFEIAKL